MPPSTGRSGGWCGGGGGCGTGGISGGREIRGADCADDPQASFCGDPSSASARQGPTIVAEAARRLRVDNPDNTAYSSSRQGPTIVAKATTSRASQCARHLRVDNPDNTTYRKGEYTANRRDFLHNCHEGSKNLATPRGSNYWGGGVQGAREGGDLCRGRKDDRVESRLFSGMRFILLGIPSNLKTECRDKIIRMGGQMLPSTDYDIATHIVLMEDLSAGANLIWRTDGKKVVKNIWIDFCCQQGRLLDEKSGGVPIVYETPTKTCSIDDDQRSVVSTSKKLRPCCHDTSFSAKRLKRKLMASESQSSRQGAVINYSSYHHWYQCKLDNSSSTNLEQWAVNNKERVTSLIITPGSEGGHYSLVPCDELILYTRKSFNAVVHMNNDKLTLRGRYSARNFLIDGSHSVRIGDVEEGSLQEYTGDRDKKSDYQGFVKMVNKELFHGKGKPDTITQWLALLLEAKVGCELLQYHFALMEGWHAAEVLMSLNDLLLDLEVSDYPAYKQVISDLAKYKGWQKKCLQMTCFLNDTFLSKDEAGRFRSTYSDDVPGLLKLIRNCRQHTARSEEELFGYIVGHLYPNFMGDFQRAMHRAGYLKNLKLQYVMG